MDELKKLPTPFFFLNQDILLADIRSLKDAIQIHWENTMIAYSVKTNSFPPLLQILRQQEVGMEVVSIDEYNLVRKCGFSSDEIVCNGPIKSECWIDDILLKQIVLNIDSKRELDFVSQFALANQTKTINVGIRVNFDIESVFSGESNGDENGIRFGFSYETGELKDIIQALKSIENINISGLHLHVSTKSRSLEIYKYLTELFITIVRDYDLNKINYFDIGGGFFGGIENPLNWNTYLETISGVLLENGFLPQNLRLIIEPGVSLIAGAFSYYSRVSDIKTTKRANFVTLDGSRIHIDPFFHKSKYFYSLVSSVKEQRDGLSQILAGFTCLEYDRFFEIKTDSFLNIGDLFIFDKVGAYTMTLSPLFISYFPPVYTLNQNGQVQILREKWGIEEFIQKTKLDI